MSEDKPRRHTHEDLRRQGIRNPDEGRICKLCECDMPHGYRHEHGFGLCFPDPEKEEE